MYSVAFIALFLVIAAFADSPANVSVYNPFRAVALKEPPKPGPPICCLKPLPSDSQEDDVLLLSFEEWKAKQAELQDKEGGAGGGSSPRNESNEGGSNGNSNHSEQDVHASVPSSMQDWDAGPAEEPISPHFRVPITDRFNYASLDCSARIHHSHRSAKSSSSILSSKRDKYMLSPCGKGDEKQFVIVELCEDIRIDTVQLANFEFFSGVFKDFAVSVAKTYTTGWVDAGSYRAKNVRGVQSFHTPPTLRDFYRFIRIDFLSFYGNEYYCPVSLLRVYGLTHLEQWKWDMWEAEGNANRAVAGDKAVEVILTRTQVQVPQQEPPLAHEAVPGVPSAESSTTKSVGVENVSPSTHAASSDTAIPSLATSTSSQTNVPERDSSQTNSSHSSNVTNDNHDPDADIDSAALPTDTYKASSIIIQVPPPTQSVAGPPVDETGNTSRSASLASTPVVVATANLSTTADQSPQLPTLSASPEISPSPSTHATPSPSSSIISVQSQTVSVHHPPPPPPPPPTPNNPFMAGGGESIYRTIMNRLTALEANHTLYTRYVEDQIGGIRGALRRLTEDVGRLEGIGKGQAQMYARTVKEWEKHRTRIDSDFTELLHRVNYLTDEVILEKRLGIAQLCLLLAVLVFMGLTRGSRMSEADLQSLLAQRIADRDRRERERSALARGVILPGARGVREWGRRHLSSISGDWVNRFRSRSPVDDEVQKENVPPLSPQGAAEEERVPFPTSGPPKLHSQPSAKRYVARTRRSRTPSLRTPLSTPRQQLAYYNFTHTHDSPIGHRTAPLPATNNTRNRSAIQRTNSHGSDMTRIATTGSWSGVIGRDALSGTKSAKRLARTAHLHEVRSREHTVAIVRDAQVSPGAVEEVGVRQLVDDMFVTPPSNSKSNGHFSPRARSPLLGRHTPRSLLIYPGASIRRSTSTDEESERDGWVDTDTTESVDGDSSSGVSNFADKISVFDSEAHGSV